MKIWKNAYKIWENFCPYYRRRLLTREDLVSWAEDANFIDKFSYNQVYFKVFIGLLIEIEALCPLIINGELLESRFYETPGVTHFGLKYILSEIELYHPIQFLEIINWAFQSRKKEPPYYDNEEYLEYYNLRALEMKIIDLKKIIKQYQYQDLDISHSKKALEDCQVQYNSNYREYPKGEDLRKLLKIHSPMWKINEKKLETLIKIESIVAPIGTDLVGPFNIGLIPIKKIRKNDINEYNLSFKDWRDDLIKNHQNFITTRDMEIMEKLEYELSRMISNDKSLITSNWLDLIEVVTPHLRQNFKGEFSYQLNLRIIRRNILRIYWELNGENMGYLGNPPRKPHFYWKNDEEFTVYLRSILLFFGLNPSHTFILYVPGKTEEIILQQYVERRWLKFLVKNMKGEDKSHFYKRVCEDIGDKDFYFLFDFHDLRNYEDKVSRFGEDCAFFYPDFITENFTIKQVYHACIFIMNNLEIYLTEAKKEEILELLKKEKEKSKLIIQTIKNNSNPSIRSAKGFENVLIDYLRNNYPKEINSKFPYILLDDNGYITGKDQTKKLKQEFKKLLANKLKIHLIKSLERDSERKKEKFPFEIKIEPFINKMLQVINAAAYWTNY
ncbi:MAG TPA: hypothetical protein ENI29_15265 [bacterium]|nr:hypothetical protein [bacterium]